MNILLVSLFAALPALAAPPAGSLKCQAMYRTINAEDQAVTQKADMPMKLDAGPFYRYEANLNNRNFNVSENTLEDSFLGQITKAPSFTEGLVVRGSADKNGNFTVASVEDRELVLQPAEGEKPAKTKMVSDVYKITCKKISQ